MRNALRVLILIGAAAAIAGCHKTQSATTNNDAMSIEDDNLTNQAPDNSQVETLPPDESSGTSSRELQNGQDNPDVNDLGNGD